MQAERKDPLKEQLSFAPSVPLFSSQIATLQINKRKKNKTTETNFVKGWGAASGNSNGFSAFTTGKGKVPELTLCVQYLQGFSGLGMNCPTSEPDPQTFLLGEGWGCTRGPCVEVSGQLRGWNVSSSTLLRQGLPCSPTLASSEQLASLVKVLRAQMQATISSFFFLFKLHSKDPLGSWSLQGMLF